MIKLLRRIVELKWAMKALERRISQVEYKVGLFPSEFKYHKSKRPYDLNSKFIKK